MKSDIYIYPTDTVWGIGGDAYEFESYEVIARTKKTSIDKPLSILFPTIDEIEDYIVLNEKLTEVIRQTHKLGMSFGIKKEFLKNSLPEKPFSNTHYVCFRVLASEFMRGLEEFMSFPIITTSLNLTGNSPITELSEAKDFWQKHLPEAKFVEVNGHESLSGQSSTIILFSEDKYKVVREGENIKSICSIVEENGYQRT